MEHAGIAQQPLDYLSQFPWTVTEADTHYRVTQAMLAMLPIL